MKLKNKNDYNSGYKEIRTWGYYRDLVTAEQSVYENWSDIYENGYYQIALIEAIGEGLLSIAKDRWWFKAIPKVNIDYIQEYIVTRELEPKWSKHIVNYAIG